MAYLKEIPKHVCNVPGCGSRASVEVFNRYNAHVGYFCATHGKRRVQKMNHDEVPEELCGAEHKDPFVVCNRPKGHKGNHSGEHPASQWF